MTAARGGEVGVPGPATDPRRGWSPHRLDIGGWGSIYLGDTSVLLSEFASATIIVQVAFRPVRDHHRNGGPGPFQPLHPTPGAGGIHAQVQAMSVAIETGPSGPDEVGREPVGLVFSLRFGANSVLILQDTLWGWEMPI